MAVMWPAGCPATANAAERAVFAAVERWLGADWAAWFQVAVPGRAPAPHPGAPRRAPAPLRADFILLGPTGLYVVETKGWRAASVVDADDSTVVDQATSALRDLAARLSLDEVPAQDD